ncbi:MAG TPA: hypothetical protein VFI42_13290 [Thermomicrobiaceae bacterium]|nr:hypothetical protein [Thermomicrobiaceae bacterium]
MVIAVEPSTETQRAALQRRQAELYRRLEDGYLRIERALAQGQDTTRWEDFWLRLLDEYERLSDDLSEDAA